MELADGRMIAPDTISLVPSAGRRILFRFLPLPDARYSAKTAGGRTLPNATIAAAAEDSDPDNPNQNPPMGDFGFLEAMYYTNSDERRDSELSKMRPYALRPQG